MVLTPSRRQRRYREVRSEGSPRRNPAPRNAIPRRRREVLGEPASCGKARYHREGPHVNAAGVGGKQLFLSGEACPGVGSNGAPTSSAERRWSTGQESAEVVVPVGMREPGRAEHQVSRAREGLEMATTIAATPPRRVWRGWKR